MPSGHRGRSGQCYGGSKHGEWMVGNANPMHLHIFDRSRFVCGPVRSGQEPEMVPFEIERYFLRQRPDVLPGVGEDVWIEETLLRYLDRLGDEIYRLWRLAKEADEDGLVHLAGHYHSQVIDLRVRQAQALDVGGVPK